MGRAKEDWLERTGGFRFGESPEGLKQRAEAIKRVEEQPLTLESIERLRRLKGEPDNEFDYQPRDGDD